MPVFCKVRVHVGGNRLGPCRPTVPCNVRHTPTHHPASAHRPHRGVLAVDDGRQGEQDAVGVVDRGVHQAALDDGHVPLQLLVVGQVVLQQRGCARCRLGSTTKRVRTRVRAPVWVKFRGCAQGCGWERGVACGCECGRGCLRGEPKPNACTHTHPALRRTASRSTALHAFTTTAHSHPPPHHPGSPPAGPWS